MEQPHFYKAQEVYGETFFQLPKVFFTNDKYKNLSNDAKVAFALLKDRFNYSVKNNWIDQNDNLYFVFTNEELMSLLQAGNQKVIKIKKELEKAELLFQKRMGLNKPNHLYLLRPKVEATDVYQQIAAKTLDNNGNVKITLPKNIDNSGDVKITFPSKSSILSPETLANSGSVKITHNLYKEQEDTNRYNTDTAKLDFSNNNYSQTELKQQNQDLISNAQDFLTTLEGNQLPLEPETIHLLSLWTQNPQQIRRFIGIIFNARHDIEQEHQDLHVHFLLDGDQELQQLITKTIRRYFNTLRSDDKKIQNYENYLYVTMKNMFANYWNAQVQQQYQE